MVSSVPVPVTDWTLPTESTRGLITWPTYIQITWFGHIYPLVRINSMSYVHICHKLVNQCDQIIVADNKIECEITECTSNIS